MNENKDQQLWRIAQKRAQFRRSLYSYLLVNALLWIVWWFSNGRTTGFSGYPWPVWVMLIWGISILGQYYSAYHATKPPINGSNR